MILTRFERATLSHCDERRRKYLLRMKSRKEMIQKNRMRTIKKRLSLLRRRLREESKFFFFSFGAICRPSRGSQPLANQSHDDFNSWPPGDSGQVRDFRTGAVGIIFSGRFVSSQPIALFPSYKVGIQSRSLLFLLCLNIVIDLCNYHSSIEA